MFFNFCKGLKGVLPFKTLSYAPFLENKYLTVDVGTPNKTCTIRPTINNPIVDKTKGTWIKYDIINAPISIRK